MFVQSQVVAQLSTAGVTNPISGKWTLHLALHLDKKPENLKPQ